MNTSHNSVAALILKDVPQSLPATRQGAVAIRKLELQLTPYPAYFRTLKEQTLLDIRTSHPDLADEIEAALDATQQAIEIHLMGLRFVNNLLNNH
ncbi:hypothetical protein [Vibrio furnissii]|uniref:hypothetical protein n=1 Tax=Vibrio furnissii TaxID=29494 RepID=UPI001EECB141|nr:hypothetical protein [Vibrio furnissii]MCG6216247.1 hypothetical protein [Vibrio furnissii]